MMRICSLLFGLMLLATPAKAQSRLSPLVKYGKWVLAAGAVGMNYLALRSHNRAEDAYDELESQCLEMQSRCDLSPDGEYLNPEIEALYQNSLRHDRITRGWLIGGEAALAGAAALFVWELTRPKSRPENIPFEPELRNLRGATGVGLRLQF
ncbi:MAG TPA: hypothetical protein VHH32_08335 [Gemmatimonadales bacterium]|nr:hypothetical protein [Gemmatimonadales bacterium]